MKVSRSYGTSISDAALSITALIKLTIARYVRGNTAAQYASILLPSEQQQQRHEAEKVADEWEEEARKTKTR